jgi:lipopolysaccharide transport system permease protein
VKVHGREGVILIRPPGWPGLGLGELWESRAICLVLARRNLMVRYRQTLVGVGWTLLQSILLMVVFTIFFGLLVRVPSHGLPYPVFFYLGLVPWQMTSKILIEGSTSVVSNSALVTRVYFPRIYFPTSIALTSLVDLTFGLLSLALLLGAFGIVPGPDVIFAPILLLLGWVTGLGLAYWLSALNVAYRDITQLLPFLAQVWMFGSPILYPSSLIPDEYQALYFANPMALVIEGFRWALTGAPAPPLAAWVVAPVVAVMLLAGGYLFFRGNESTFSDVI